MEFEKERIALRMSALIVKKNNDELSASEQIVLQEWLNQNAAHQEIYDELSNQDSIIKAMGGLNKYPTNEALQRVKNLVAQKTTQLWPRIAIAAASIAAAIFGIWLYTYSPIMHSETVAGIHDIAPGKRGATLTLANGKQIKLGVSGNGELANEAGVIISKLANGQIVYQMRAQSKNVLPNTLSTAKGETYQLRLSDGSKVWLNAASSLTYAASLNENGERRVKLDGEAYFEVAKDKSHPFIVETGTQRVQVLGTHFNINSYADEPFVATTLLEGSVKVSQFESPITRLLKPGEQAINKNNNIQVVNANMEQVMDWKDGDFYLNHVNFKTAMRKIARWYNVEVVYDASVSDAMESGGWISRNKKLSEVLQSIEAAGQVHFKIEGRKIIVLK